MVASTDPEEGLASTSTVDPMEQSLQEASLGRRQDQMNVIDPANFQGNIMAIDPQGFMARPGDLPSGASMFARTTPEKGYSFTKETNAARENAMRENELMNQYSGNLRDWWY